MEKINDDIDATFEEIRDSNDAMIAILRAIRGKTEIISISEQVKERRGTPDDVLRLSNAEIIREENEVERLREQAQKLEKAYRDAMKDHNFTPQQEKDMYREYIHTLERYLREQGTVVGKRIADNIVRHHVR